MEEKEEQEQIRLEDKDELVKILGKLKKFLE